MKTKLLNLRRASFARAIACIAVVSPCSENAQESNILDDAQLANEAISPAIPQANEAIFSPTKVVGFDEELAANNGFAIKTTPDGKQYSVAQGVDPSAAEISGSDPVQPEDIVYGNCGNSWVFFDVIGQRKGNLRTGFRGNGSGTFSPAFPSKMYSTACRARNILLPLSL